MAAKTLEMIRAIRAQQYEETKAMTTEERHTYYRDRARQCRQRLAASLSPSRAPSSPPA